MAEIVELRDLPVYEQMRALSLFTDEQIKKMEKARQKFENRLTQPSCEVKDFLEYIKYDRSIISLTEERGKWQKIGSFNTIEIVNRMKQIYEQGLSKFPQDTQFWNEYIIFLRSFGFINEISETFERMLQFHGDKPEVWSKAILWEYDENYAEDRARGLLLRAQQRHPEAQGLYLLFFRIELENKRQVDETLAMQHASVVYTNGKLKFDKVDYLIEMLKVADGYLYARSTQHQILFDMKLHFNKVEIMWHTMAQRALHELFRVAVCTGNCVYDQGTLVIPAILEGRKSVLLALEKCIELCIYIYESAILEVDTMLMWDYYINAMLEINTDLTTHVLLRTRALNHAFESAYERNKMNENHCVEYVELLHAHDPEQELILQVLETGLTSYQTSPKLWQQYLRYHIELSNFKKVQEVFKNAKKNLGSDGYKIWEIYLQYLQSPRTGEEAAAKELRVLINELAHQHHPQFNTIKASVLELQEMAVNIRRARTTYNMFIRSYPNCLEVHEKMADLESKQLVRNSKAERNCLEMLILNFGKTRADVWLRYMRFERSVGNPKNVGKLYEKAVITLIPDLLQGFLSLHNELMNKKA